MSLFVLFTKVSKLFVFFFELIWFLCLFTRLEIRNDGRNSTCLSGNTPIGEESGCCGFLQKKNALPGTLDIVASIMNESVAKYCGCYSRLADAFRFAGMYLNGQRETMTDRRGLRHDTDIGA